MMAEAEEEGAPTSSKEQQHQLSSSPGGPVDTQPATSTEGTEKRAEHTQPATSTEGTEKRAEHTQPAAPAEATEKRAEHTQPATSTEGTEKRAEHTQPAAPAEATEKRAEHTQPATSTEGTEKRAEHTQPPAPTEATEKRAEHTQPAAPTEGTEKRAEHTQPAAPAEGTEKRAAAGVLGEDRLQHSDYSVESPLVQFKIRKFFVLRPGTLKQAIKDVEALVDQEVDGSINSLWLMAEVDHWNNEKERLVLITENSLLIFKYDFVMFNCEQVQRISLNLVDRISYGTFSFPKRALIERDGEGVRVFWDRLREPSFTSRWNPFATDFPFITFTHHPVRNVSDTFVALCDIHKFREQLTAAAQKVHAIRPVPGKANGVLVLNQPIHIDAFVGLMSFLGNQNKLGYCVARGNLGF